MLHDVKCSIKKIKIKFLCVLFFSYAFPTSPVLGDNFTRGNYHHSGGDVGSNKVEFLFPGEWLANDAVVNFANKTVSHWGWGKTFCLLALL